MNSVIIFDVSDDATKSVREGMRAKGYYFSWGTQENLNMQFNLPFNVVWKPNTESQDALNDLESVISQINTASGKTIKLERCVVLNSTPWRAIVGEKVS